MQLKDMVCDIEYAEKLKELRIQRTENLFHYGIHKGRRNVYLNHGSPIGQNCTITYGADELLEMLPREISRADLQIRKGRHTPNSCTYFDLVERAYIWTESDGKLPNALAKLLIWCIEEGHVKVEDLNAPN